MFVSRKMRSLSVMQLIPVFEEQLSHRVTHFELFNRPLPYLFVFFFFDPFFHCLPNCPSKASLALAYFPCNRVPEFFFNFIIYSNSHCAHKTTTNYIHLLFI